MVQIDPKRQQELIDDEALGEAICNQLIEGLTPRTVLRELIEDEEDNAEKLTIDEIRFVGSYWRDYIREEKKKKATEKEQKRIKDKREARFQAMKAEGKTLEQIARETGESLETVIHWGQEHKGDIQTFEAVRLESLRERYPVSKAQRIAFLGEQINRVKGELLNRDLQDVPTEKLFYTLTQLTKLAKDEDPIVTITL